MLTRTYPQRRKVENPFVRIEDWWRIAMRYRKLARNVLATTYRVGALRRIRLNDLEPDFWPLHAACRAATMTWVEGQFALYKAVEYLVRYDIPGDFVECGVWRGGSVMMMALALQKFGAKRRIHCFDTFEGMPPPTSEDIWHGTGESAASLLARRERRESELLWAIAGLDLVRRNVASTGYPPDLVSFVQGRVEETIPRSAPDKIALLRLDTDWYQSTKHEMVHLYPRLVRGGVLIVDDYGAWLGARKAVDEYFRESGEKVFLNRIDDTGGRTAIKAL